MSGGYVPSEAEVEAAARAIEGCAHGGAAFSWDSIDEGARESWRREATAALVAAHAVAPCEDVAEQPFLAQRLYVALVEQRVIDGQKYGEFPYAPITREDVDAALAAFAAPSKAADR
jgi:hypothetical protein